MSDEALLSPADLSRRRFLVHGCAAATLIGLGFPLSACDSGQESSTLPAGVTMNGNVLTIDLRVATALAAPGGMLQIGSARVVAVNVGGMINAFTNVCPHEQQQVSQFTNGNLVCPTHDSVFNGTTGAFIEGPARTGLTKYTTTRAGATVTITKS